MIVKAMAQSLETLPEEVVEKRDGLFLGVHAETKHKILARRSQLEVRMDMLKAVKAGASKPTQILYKANLSWITLQNHLEFLVERGLLRGIADGSKRQYEITPKASNIMYSYAKLLEEVGDGSEFDFLFG